jgi:uncharacterized protein YkwD
MGLDIVIYIIISMLRQQTTFGIVLSTIVFAAGFTSCSVPTHSLTKKPLSTPRVVNPANRVISSTSALKPRDLEKSVFEQVNRYRSALGLSKLNLNAEISKQARIHSQNMARGKVPFSHNGFKRRVNAVSSIRYRSAAENVAFNQGYNEPANEAIVGWLTSPGHLQNIKGNYNLTGIGVATNQQGEIYFTQIFFRTK